MTSSNINLERRSRERAESRKQRRQANRKAREESDELVARAKRIRNKRILGKIMESADGRGFLFDTLKDWGYFDSAPQSDPVLLARVTARRDCAGEFANVASLQFPGSWTKMIQENHQAEDLSDHQERESINNG